MLWSGIILNVSQTRTQCFLLFVCNSKTRQISFGFDARSVCRWHIKNFGPKCVFHILYQIRGRKSHLNASQWIKHGERIYRLELDWNSPLAIRGFGYLSSSPTKFFENRSSSRNNGGLREILQCLTCFVCHLAVNTRQKRAWKYLHHRSTQIRKSLHDARCGEMLYSTHLV